MSLVRTIRTLLVCAGLALAAGCAGAQVAPSAPAGSPSLSAARAPSHALAYPVANRVLGELMLRRAQRAARFRDPALPLSMRFDVGGPQVTKPPPFSFIFLSDNVTGNLDSYNELNNGAQIGSMSGACGWGVATYTVAKVNLLACGNAAGLVLTGSVTASGAVFNGKLSVSQPNSVALGLTWDSKGDLYATNFPTSGSSTAGNCVDYFSKATIAGDGAGKPGPDATYCSKTFSYVYYLTIDGAALYADGYDPNLNFVVADVSVNKKITGKGSTKLLQTLGTYETGFPGGMAITGGHEMYVDNQYGQITGYPKPYKVNGMANQTLPWTFDPDDFSAICLDSAQTSLWLADDYFLSASGFETYGEAGSVPLNTVGPSVTSPAYASETYLGCGLEPTGKT